MEWDIAILHNADRQGGYTITSRRYPRLHDRRSESGARSLQKRHHPTNTGYSKVVKSYYYKLRYCYACHIALLAAEDPISRQLSTPILILKTLFHSSHPRRPACQGVNGPAIVLLNEDVASPRFLLNTTVNQLSPARGPARS